MKPIAPPGLSAYALRICSFSSQLAPQVVSAQGCVMTLIARPLALVPDGPGGPAGPAGPGGPAGPVGPASPLAGGSLCPHASNRKAAEIIKSKRRINHLKRDRPCQ